MKSIDNIIPIIDIEDKKMLNTHEVISVAFEVENYTEVFLATKEFYNDLNNRLSIFIKQLPDFTIYHTISMYDEESYIPDFNTPDNFLQKSNKLHYLKRSMVTEKQYIILTFADAPLTDNLSGHSMSRSLKYLVKNPYENYKNDLEKIDGHIANAITSLQGVFPAECKIKRLENDEMALMLYRYYSLEYNYDGPVENLRLPDYNFNTNTIGEYYLGALSIYEGIEAASFTLADQTRASTVKSSIKQISNIGNISQSQMFPVTIGLPFKHVYSVIVQKLSTEKLLNQFEFKERSLGLPKTFGMQSAINQLEDIAKFKRAISELNYTPVNVSMACLIPERDKSLLNMKLEATKSAVAGISEMRAIPEKEEVELTFLAHSPGNATSSYKNNLTTSVHAVSYLPKESHYKSDGTGFGFTDRYGSKILVDILNSPHMTNKNGIVIGPSGRGKSYTLNYIVSLIYNEGHVFIIDKGGSYKGICNQLGGQYLDSKNEELFRFSPFVTERNLKGEYLVDEIQLNFLKSIIIFIWKEGGKATPEESKVLANLINDYYKLCNTDKAIPNFAGFFDFVVNRSKNPTEMESKYFEFDSFKLMCIDYAHGNESKLLNSPTELDLTDEKFVVFEMGAIEKENAVKFKLLCLIITFLNLKKIRRLERHIFKCFMIDEALSFLQGDIGLFIGNLYAEIRKENGQVLIVAQGIQFILEASPEVYKKIFANRDFIVMTNHSGYENVADDYRKLLNFSDKHLELLFSVKKSEEIFMRLGDHGMILRIDVSPEEHALFTTDPEEMKTLGELEKETGSLQSAVVEFARRKRKKTQI